MLFGDVTSILDLNKVSEDARRRVERRTIDLRTRINTAVWEFVRRNDRIIYGGAALDALIRTRDSASGIYNDSCTADIEFYSHEPGSDVVALCNLLHHDLGMQHVHGREAIHPGTLTVSVDFVRCFDVTFMSRTTMANLPFLRSKCGGRCAHPHVMAMDLLRMMTEPDTSYWRLDKAFARFKSLEENFPLGWGRIQDVQQHTSPSPHMTGDWWHVLDNCVGVGDIALMYYTAMVTGVKRPIRVQVLQLVTTDYDIDLEIARPLVSQWTNACTEIHYDAFGDLLGRSVRFIDKCGVCVVELIDAHPRCVPLSPNGPKRGRIASSLYCMVTAMACHLRAFVNREESMIQIQAEVCTRLIESREASKYLEAPTLNAFYDFDLDHIHGITTPGMQLQYEAHTMKEICRSTKKRSNKSTQKNINKSWLRYNPSEGEASMHYRNMVQACFPIRAGNVVGSRRLDRGSLTTDDGVSPIRQHAS